MCLFLPFLPFSSANSFAKFYIFPDSFKFSNGRRFGLLETFTCTDCIQYTDMTGHSFYCFCLQKNHPMLDKIRILMSRLNQKLIEWIAFYDKGTIIPTI